MRVLAGLYVLVTSLLLALVATSAIGWLGLTFVLFVRDWDWSGVFTVLTAVATSLAALAFWLRSLLGSRIQRQEVPEVTAPEREHRHPSGATL